MPEGQFIGLPRMPRCGRIIPMEKTAPPNPALDELAERINSRLADRMSPAPAPSVPVPTTPYRCSVCGGCWFRPATDPPPSRCPLCFTDKWNRPPATFVCRDCGRSWIVPEGSMPPPRCPFCRSTKWNRPAVPHKCLRCGHEWISSKTSRPGSCPACKNTAWDRPRKYRKRQHLMQDSDCGNRQAMKPD